MARVLVAQENQAINRFVTCSDRGQAAHLPRLAHHVPHAAVLHRPRIHALLQPAAHHLPT
jgi:hypothetical protein